MSSERIGLFDCYLFFTNILQGFTVLWRMLVDEVMGGGSGNYLEALKEVSRFL